MTIARALRITCVTDKNGCPSSVRSLVVEPTGCSAPMPRRPARPSMVCDVSPPAALRSSQGGGPDQILPSADQDLTCSGDYGLGVRWLRRRGSRVTGISTPLLGVSWTPGVSDEEQARALLAFLEDRRVLFAPEDLEDASHCVVSVERIRDFLTGMLTRGGLGDAFVDRLEKMRSAARRFMEQIRPPFERPDELWIPGHGLLRGGPRLHQALGELRGVFGVHLGEIAQVYGLEVRRPLSSILPRIANDPPMPAR